jgi:transposase
MARRDELTDAQWALIEPLFPKAPRKRGKGRPLTEARPIMNGVLWILRTGARWKDLPERYPPYQTCHRRLQRWVQTGVLEKVLKALARQLKDESDFDLEECFIDGSFVGAKKGALPSARPSGARVRSSWQWQTALALRWPYTSNPRVRTKSSSSTPRSMRASPRTNRSD